MDIHHDAAVLPLNINLRYQQAALAGDSFLQAHLLGQFQAAAKREAALLVEAMVEGDVGLEGPQERGALRLQILGNHGEREEEVEWCRREVGAIRWLTAQQLGQRGDAGKRPSLKCL